MKAGDLRHRITLQRAETHTDERGRRITAWRDVATVMAAMADVSQKNLYVAQAYHAEDILTFTIRYRRASGRSSGTAGVCCIMASTTKSCR